MKNGKRESVEGTVLPNQESIRMLWDKENNNYLGILEVDTINQMDMKEKNKTTSEERESFSKLSSVAEISSKK